MNVGNISDGWYDADGNLILEIVESDRFEITITATGLCALASLANVSLDAVLVGPTSYRGTTLISVCDPHIHDEHDSNDEPSTEE